MSEFRAFIQNGQVVRSKPIDLPDRTQVMVRVALDHFFMTEEEQGDDPESIARWIAAVDALEPLVFSPDEARIPQARADQKAWEIANWDKHCRELESLFDEATPTVIVESG